MPRSRRYEFSKPVKREADKRAAGRCEATGEVYGLPSGQRCNAPFKGGRKEFDHYPVPATEEGSDTVENCVVCCPDCHRFKTRTFDVPGQAKRKRVSDKHRGITRPSGFATNRNGKYKKRMSGEVVLR